MVVFVTSSKNDIHCETHFFSVDHFNSAVFNPSVALIEYTNHFATTITKIISISLAILEIVI